MPFDWVDKVNEQDFYNADDINAIAHEAIRLQSSKVDKIEGKSLSENDYTDEDKEKLSELPNASKYQSDLNDKVDKIEGMGLSSNDFTDEDKQKLDSLSEGGGGGAIPTKISDLEDDTNGTTFQVKYANFAISADSANNATHSDSASFADMAIADYNGNEIIKTYATKDELPSKITDLEDDTSDLNPINYAERSSYALSSDHSRNSDIAVFAENSYRDAVNNLIHETYATKLEMNQKGELIEEIVITEENIRIISRDAEPDSTPYNFKAVAVYQEVRPATVTNYIKMTAYSLNGSTRVELASNTSSNITTTSTGNLRFTQALFDVLGGYWVGLGGGNSGGNPATLTCTLTKLYNGERIQAIDVRGVTTAFEVGSVIRIYGVR